MTPRKGREHPTWEEQHSWRGEAERQLRRKRDWSTGWRDHRGLPMACSKDLAFLLSETGGLWSVLCRGASSSDCYFNEDSEVWGWIKRDNARKSTQCLEHSKNRINASFGEEGS